jgi:large subunit ribosomal protein L18
MLKTINRLQNRIARKRRVRGKISGTALIPRVAVCRSLRAISVQCINDETGTTLAQAHLRETGKAPKNTVEGAEKVGTLLGERLKAAGIEAVVFDRAGYKYHGKVKVLADAIRAQGIQF